MAIKESSDELNPVVVSGSPSNPPAPPRSLKDYVALGVATCGVGYLPLAPGTWGSLVAVGYYLALRWAVFGRFSNSNETADAIFHWKFLGGELVAIAAASGLGVWAASRTERVLQ